MQSGIISETDLLFDYIGNFTKDDSASDENVNLDDLCETFDS